VVFAVLDGSFQHVSFASSILTMKGGTHVNYIAAQVSKGLINVILKKNKGAAVKPLQIKNHAWIFINCLIKNPAFDSQTKGTLTLPALLDGLMKKGNRILLRNTAANLVQVMKSTIVDNILNWARAKADQQIKKTDGTKRSRYAAHLL